MNNLFNNTLVCTRLHSMVTLKWSLLLLMLLFSVPIFAQDCVTKFMGIPVDGTQEEMFSALEKKGFKRVRNEYLVGEFNGRENSIAVVTNKGKVYCVGAIDGNLDDITVVRRFNNVFSMLKNSPKYSYIEGELIPSGEDVGYNILVKNHVYEAYFQQIENNSDGPLICGIVRVHIDQVSVSEYMLIISYYNMNNYPNGEDL